MIRQNGAPTAADHATTTATTITTDGSSFVEIGLKLAEPGHTNRTHLDTSSAIVTSREPQNTLRVESLRRESVQDTYDTEKASS